MRGALGWRMIVVGVLCALGIAALLGEMAALLPFLSEERRARTATPLPPGALHIRFHHSIICFGLIGWLGSWGYLASWVWLPAAAWRVRRRHRQGGPLRPLDLFLPSVVALEIVALQCLLRLTLLQDEGYPLF